MIGTKKSILFFIQVNQYGNGAKKISRSQGASCRKWLRSRARPVSSRRPGGHSCRCLFVCLLSNRRLRSHRDGLLGRAHHCLYEGDSSFLSRRRCLELAFVAFFASFAKAFRDFSLFRSESQRRYSLLHSFPIRNPCPCRLARPPYGIWRPRPSVDLPFRFSLLRLFHSSL